MVNRLRIKWNEFLEYSGSGRAQQINSLHIEKWSKFQNGSMIIAIKHKDVYCQVFLLPNMWDEIVVISELIGFNDLN